jgi:hypothetical protein
MAKYLRRGVTTTLSAVKHLPERRPRTTVVKYLPEKIAAEYPLQKPHDGGKVKCSSTNQYE